MRCAARFTAPRLIHNRDRDAVLGREAARVAGVRGCTLGGSSLAEQGYARRDGDDMVFVPCDVACSASARASIVGDVAALALGIEPLTELAHAGADWDVDS